MHEFIEELLVERLVAKAESWKGNGPWNLCFAGGCALNIKWNSAMRAHKAIREMWVPPFPDDSGSAVGTGAILVSGEQRLAPISWNVFAGPDLVPTRTFRRAGRWRHVDRRSWPGCCTAPVSRWWSCTAVPSRVLAHSGRAASSPRRWTRR